MAFSTKTLHLFVIYHRVAAGAPHRDVFIHGRYHEAARRGCFGLEDSETLPPAHYKSTTVVCRSEKQKNASCVSIVCRPVPSQPDWFTPYLVIEGSWVAQIQRAIVTLYCVEKADVTVVVRRSAS